MSKNISFRPRVIIKYNQMFRHSMTNLYETLGVSRKATLDEIMQAYKGLEKVFVSDHMDSNTECCKNVSKFNLKQL